MTNKNTFKGSGSIKDYLNPKNHITPLVELPSSHNKFYDRGVRVYAKLLQNLPLFNVKSIPAYSMLEKLQADSILESTDTIIESSSGNTALSLATTARQFNINKTIAMVSSEISPGKLKLLQLFGLDIIVNKEPICPDPNDKTSGINKAKQLAKKNRWVNPSQYSNPSNPEAHRLLTAPQIYRQLEGDIQLFVAGLGTAGTIVGCSIYFKKKNSDIQIIGVVRTPNNPVPGVRTKNLLNMSNFAWQNHADSLQEIDTFSSYLTSLELIRLGIMAGPSSGLNLAGLYKYLDANIDTIDQYRNKDGILNCVFICCDSPLPYLDEYFQYLDSTEFREIKNIDLLDQSFELNPRRIQVNEITVADAYKKLYKNSLNYELNDDVELIDVRPLHEFNHSHLPMSKQINFDDIENNNLNALKQINPSKIVFVICNAGNRSYSAVFFLEKNKINAVSIKGGFMEWSNHGLPRHG